MTVLPILACCLSLSTPAESAELYIGTYTGKESRGIYRATLDLETGRLSTPELVAESPNPSFLAIHPSGRFLFAVNETGDFQGKPSGAVSAFAIDPKTRQLTLLNQQPSGGSSPCHLTVDRRGESVLLANYGGGSVETLPIEPNGHLGSPVSHVQHQGQGVDPRRQEKPHAHSINLDAANRFAVVADLGLDQLRVYRFDEVHHTIEPNDPPALALEPGSGPRHLAFHPGGRHAFVINEMALTVTALDYDPATGSFRAKQTLSTLPDGIKDRQGFSTAEVVVHPNGQFLYGSNRGHNSLSVFKIDSESGRLKWIENVSSGGKTPRNFVIDPNGRHVLAANQDSNTIAVFAIDQTTGRLRAVGEPIPAPNPVCLRFTPSE